MPKSNNFKPIVFIWVKKEWLRNDSSHEFPATWHSFQSKKTMSEDWIQIAITYTWFKRLLEYEKKMAQDDLPF